MSQRNFHLFIDEDDFISLNVHVSEIDEIITSELNVMTERFIGSLTSFDSNKATSIDVVVFDDSRFCLIKSHDFVISSL